MTLLVNAVILMMPPATCLSSESIMLILCVFAAGDKSQVQG